MLLEKSLQKAKRTEDEKVGLNIKVPIGMKNEFDELCKQHGVSMTSMMLSLIETIIEESRGNIDARELEFKRLANQAISDNEEWCEHFLNNVDPDHISTYTEKTAETQRLKQLLQ